MTSVSGSNDKNTAAVDRRGLRVLSFEECLQRVASAPVGRVAFRTGGELVILPVNHVSDGVAIAFRTTWGSKLAAAASGDPVAFEIDHFDQALPSGWSVLVKGTAAIVEDEDTVAKLEDQLGILWTGPPEDAFWVRIRPDEVTGREFAG